MSKDGADEFAREAGLEQVPNRYFITPERLQGAAEGRAADFLGRVGAGVLRRRILCRPTRAIHGERRSRATLPGQISG